MEQFRQEMSTSRNANHPPQLHSCLKNVKIVTMRDPVTGFTVALKDFDFFGRLFGDHAFHIEIGY